MEAVVGLLLVLIRVSQGVETSCDGRQDGAQCLGALGGDVNVLLMNNTSEIPRFEWHKSDSIVLKWRNNRIITNTMEKRSNFISSNGIFRINILNWNDSGEYKLVTFNSKAEQLGQRTLQLSVQAPVSSVQLVSECLSQGQMNVSCSSEGDSPQYSWTLDGHTLTDSELLSGNNKTNVIILRQNISGHLVCSVKNQVSRSFREENISTCGFIFINCSFNGTHISEWVFGENDTLCDEPTSVPPMNNQTDLPWYINQWPVIVGVLSAFVFVLVVTAVMFAKRKTHKEEEEPTYIDIRIIQQQKRQKDQIVQSMESQSL